MVVKGKNPHRGATLDDFCLLSCLLILYSLCMRLVTTTGVCFILLLLCIYFNDRDDACVVPVKSPPPYILVFVILT